MFNSKSMIQLEGIGQPLLDRILDLIVAVQQIPAPTFDESKRGQFVSRQFELANLSDVTIDELGNVYATRPGLSRSEKPILVSAHLDTVFPHDVDLTVRRTPTEIHGPGIGDNSTAVASLVGLNWLFDEQEIKLATDVIFVANVGEEGLGDLCGMRQVIDKLSDNLRATIVLEGIGLGRVYRQAVGSRRYRVTTRASGGHSWGDFPSPSAIHKLMDIGSALSKLKVPSHPKTTFNIGVIDGGTSINTIAEDASLLLDLRSASPAELENLIIQALAIVKEFDNGQVAVEVEQIGDRPAGSISVEHPLLTLAMSVLESVGIGKPRYAIGSTDANIPLSRNLPAVCIALTNGANAHRHDEYIETGALATGLRQAGMLIANACIM